MVRASDGWHSTSIELNSVELVMLAVDAALTVCAAQHVKQKFLLLHVNDLRLKPFRLLHCLCMFRS